ncbi:MAG: dienelactone hydrolase family protein [Xanthobacteraceae bacterium]
MRSDLRRPIFAVACLAATALAPQVGSAQVARTELHAIPTLTMSDRQFLTGDRNGVPVTIGGVLRLPRLGTERLPAVVLVHGSGGIGGNVDRWAQEINGIGVATFIIDSFTARGIQSTSANQALLGRLNMVLDVYRSLALLSAHPRIDPARIVLMGFSRGGQATLYASLKRFERMHGPEGAAFAAFIPFYAPCFTTYLEDEDVSDKPIRLFHGIADDYVPVAPCRSYVERLRKAGKDVTLTEYPGAHHAFDNPVLKEGPQLAPQSQTTRRCIMKEEPAGVIINAETKQPFTMEDPCVERGPHVGHNAAAISAATQAVKEFLRTNLKLN